MRFSKTILAGLGISTLMVFYLLHAQTGSKEDWLAGAAVYEAKDYTTAMRYFKPLAERGLADAQFNVGVMYVYGKGIARRLCRVMPKHNLMLAPAIIKAKASPKTSNKQQAIL